MSVLIKGLGMPKDGEHPYWVTIHPDGTVEYNENKGQGWQTSEAVPVPDHGRLIDADALDKQIYNDILLKVFGNIARMAEMRNIVYHAPTIIPAEETTT